jgi:hypothetical protein
MPASRFRPLVAPQLASLGPHGQAAARRCPRQGGRSNPSHRRPVSPRPSPKGAAPHRGRLRPGGFRPVPTRGGRRSLRPAERGGRSLDRTVGPERPYVHLAGRGDGQLPTALAPRHATVVAGQHEMRMVPIIPAGVDSRARVCTIPRWPVRRSPAPPGSWRRRWPLAPARQAQAARNRPRRAPPHPSAAPPRRQPTLSRRQRHRARAPSPRRHLRRRASSRPPAPTSSAAQSPPRPLSSSKDAPADSGGTGSWSGRTPPCVGERGLPTRR